MKNAPKLKRALSEPCFHSWDFGYINDVFEAEYDISPAITERNAWDDQRPPTPQSDGEGGDQKSTRDLIVRSSDSGYGVIYLSFLMYL
jgi:hypothetical protein